jgi:DNA-binding transcriptional ArsR family regulator
MTPMSANDPRSAGTEPVADGLSVAFGVAAASSLRQAGPRQRGVAEKTASVHEGSAAKARSSTEQGAEVYSPDVPDSTTRPGEAEAHRSAASETEHVMSAERFPTVQVRDRQIIDGFLLAATKASPTGRHLIDFIRDSSDGVFDLSASVVYRELHRLEKERLIVVTREGGNRYYTLTEVGERVLARRRREWESISHGLSGLLEVTDG